MHQFFGVCEGRNTCTLIKVTQQWQKHKFEEDLDSRGQICCKNSVLLKVIIGHRLSDILTRVKQLLCTHHFS